MKRMSRRESSSSSITSQNFYTRGREGEAPWQKTKLEDQKKTQKNKGWGGWVRLCVQVVLRPPPGNRSYVHDTSTDQKYTCPERSTYSSGNRSSVCYLYTSIPLKSLQGVHSCDPTACCGRLAPRKKELRLLTWGLTLCTVRMRVIAPPKTAFQNPIAPQPGGFQNAEKGGFGKIPSRAFRRRCGIRYSQPLLVVEQSSVEKSVQGGAMTRILTVEPQSRFGDKWLGITRAR